MSVYTPIPRSAPVQMPAPAHVVISLKLADPASDMLVRHVRLLRDCVALAQQRWGFEIDAAAVLPSEVMLLCGFDDAQFGVSGAIRLIQTAFARHALDGLDVEWSNESEVIEISPAVVPLRRAYIEDAPVRAGLVQSAVDWPYSSAQSVNGQAADLGVAVA